MPKRPHEKHIASRERSIADVGPISRQVRWQTRSSFDKRSVKCPNYPSIADKMWTFQWSAPLGVDSEAVG
jgi:hypothetical protein